MKTVLSIAGSDSGGGAGIQADLKTIAALGCYGTTAVTAVTAQNTLGVQKVLPIPGHLIAEQIEAVLSDIGADAVKIGMLFDADAAAAVARELEAYEGPVIFDPVMRSKSQCVLMREDALSSLEPLLSRALLVMPNAEEAKILGKRGVKNLLLKGGHTREPDRLFLENGTVLEFETAWIDTKNTHGTGCTLSSAIASFLALGNDLPAAVARAKAYLQGAVAASLFIGRGIGPLHHFWRQR